MFMLNLFNNSVCESLAIEINETSKSVHLLFLLLKSNETPCVDISAEQMFPVSLWRPMRMILSDDIKKAPESIKLCCSMCEWSSRAVCICYDGKGG